MLCARGVGPSSVDIVEPTLSIGGHGAYLRPGCKFVIFLELLFLELLMKFEFWEKMFILETSNQ